jgi:hypothetical protein
MSVPIQAQVRCAERELAKRQAVYPKLIQERKLPQVKADEEIAAMTAIVETLKRSRMLSEVSEEIKAEEANKQELKQSVLI